MDQGNIGTSGSIWTRKAYGRVSTWTRVVYGVGRVHGPGGYIVNGK